MSKIAAYTQAYNAEKTLRQSLDSVLGQTVSDLTFYVVDNCSTDGTRDIIREYAAKDFRVRPIYYDTDDHTGSAILRVLHTLDHIREAAEFEWLCVLDADDTYEPEFLQEMLDFIERWNLDMAVCSSRFIQADTGIQVGARAVPREILISGEGFGTYFQVYHQFMRTWWAKLISRDVVMKSDLKSLERNTSVGGDTMLAFEFLRHCGRVGISPKLLHNYMVSPTSISYRLDPRRIGADAIQHDDTIQFLNEKVGKVSAENRRFLYIVYYHATIDTLNVLLNASNASMEEKLSGTRQLLCIDVTQEMLQSDAIEAGKRKELLKQLLKFVSSLEEGIGPYEDGIWLGLTLSSLIGDQAAFIRFSKFQIRYLLDQRREEEAQTQLAEWEAILPNDPTWRQLRSYCGKF